MRCEELLSRIRTAVYDKLSKESTGHDFNHVERVSRLAGYLAKENDADEFICRAAGYLHDYCRPDERSLGQLHYGNVSIAQIAGVLEEIGVNADDMESILICIAEHECYPHKGEPEASTIESKILQDADRLDAVGAIGIARTFMFTGAVDGMMFDPSADRKNTGCDTAIAYFYTMLLELPVHMYTPQAKQIAVKRKEFIKNYLEEFYDEWFLSEDLA